LAECLISNIKQEIVLKRNSSFRLELDSIIQDFHQINLSYTAYLFAEVEQGGGNWRYTVQDIFQQTY